MLRVAYLGAIVSVVIIIFDNSVPRVLLYLQFTALIISVSFIIMIHLKYFISKYHEYYNDPK